MRYKTSFYNPTLGKQLVLRFWPLLVLYTIIWALLFPMQGISLEFDASYSFNPLSALFPVLAVFRYMVPWGALLAGGVAAMVVCSHLYSTRSANFTAALSPKRTAQFLTHYLTGLLCLVVPFLLMWAIAMGIFLAKIPDAPLVWQVFEQGLGFALASLVFFYSFGVVCGMLTGHILGLPVFYAIFNTLVWGVWFLLTFLFQSFYYGYPGTITQIPTWVEWLTPIIQLTTKSLFLPYTEDFPMAPLIYGVIGVALAALAWVLYIKRPMERAGDVVIWAGLRPIFRYGVAICSGLSLGVLTQMILSLEQLGLAISVILWGVAGCFVGQMFLSKSVRVLRYWKGALAVAGTFLALFLGMKFDLTGYVTRIPSPDQVASVELSGLFSYPSDDASYLRNASLSNPDTIAQVLALHSTLVEEYSAATLPDPFYASRTDQVTLIYHLSNGTQLHRQYNVNLQYSSSQANSITQQVEQLMKQPDVVLAAYGLNQVEQWERDGYSLAYGYTSYQEFLPEQDPEDTNKEFTSATAKRIYQALLQDIDQGNITRELWDSNSTTLLQLSWTNNDTEQVERRDHSITMYLPETATNTLAVLETLPE